MGAWGIDTFENDQACDWAHGLWSEGEGWVRDTLARCGDDGGYIDAAAGCQALAACDVVARMLGRFGQRDAYTEDVDEWVASQDRELGVELRDTAHCVVEFVSGERSDLRQLWEESGQGDAWLSVVHALRDRLTS